MFITALRLPELTQSGYHHGLPVVKHLLARDKLTLNAPVTFILGDNGAGKSTLIEAIAVAMGFNAEGGNRNARFTTEWTVSPLHKDLVVRRQNNPMYGHFLRAESHYNLASYYQHLRGEEDMNDLHKMSHGESVIALLERRFYGPGLFILDEPEAGLSPIRQMAMIPRIHRIAEAGGQVIAATHSAILPAVPGAQLLEITEDNITEVAYDQSECVSATREFLDDPHGIAHYLLEE